MQPEFTVRRLALELAVVAAAVGAVFAILHFS